MKERLEVGRKFPGGRWVELCVGLILTEIAGCNRTWKRYSGLKGERRSYNDHRTVYFVNYS